MACWIGLVAGWFVSVYMVYALPNIPVEELLKPLPVVIWHGLGDSAYSPFLLGMKDDVQKMYPGIYVHLVAIEPSLFADQRATIFGNVNCQINKVHRQLSQIPELQYGFDAVGFSQGGQFLRGYVERFNSPRVRNLITFGSQHMGITNLHTCAPMDAICHTVHGILMGGVYTDYAQNSVVTAQYFRDTRTKQQFDLYQHNNHFLHDINNEGIDRNATYKANLQRLDKFVMIQFTEESTVIPAASSWFEACVDPDHREGFTDRIVPLRSTDLYQEDWIGLRALDRKGALTFQKCEGRHMNIDSECFVKIFGQYVGRPLITRPWMLNWMNRVPNPLSMTTSMILLSGLLVFVLCENRCDST
ncbi:palmitoyl-protein hydrolase [Malassezia yamatoensis]|uniref:Palmitoyl-protein thioesterase 1 n=1 Tax=Malassezia yamatoensis TaxID=253288 RepID=A0AAJ6CHL4_9BASI|nr:palmitoyl-protein hydrolase [Malassezia yamatoensis]